MNAPGELLFEIRDLAKVSDSVVNRSLKVLRVDPGELVEILSASVSPGRGQVTPSSNLRVELRAKRTPLAGPPCRVELSVEGPASVQGIRGNLRGTVPANGDILVLEAQGIPAVGEGTGVFTLSVDGVPLTYRFSADFAVFDRVEGAELERVPFLGLKASMALPVQGCARFHGQYERHSEDTGGGLGEPVPCRFNPAASTPWQVISSRTPKRWRFFQGPLNRL